MKRLLVGLFLVAALAAVAIVMVMNQDASTIRSELSDFAVKDTAAIDRIVLKDEQGNMVDLRRKSPGYWTVNMDHHARPDAIDNLLTTIAKVSVKSPVSETAMQTILKQIIASHVLVDIYAGSGDPVKSYYVGGANQLHTGTNMMMTNSTRPFVMHIEGFHGFLTPRYFTNELEWRSREVFEYTPDQISSVQISYPEDPERNFRVEKEAGQEQLVYRGAEMDQPANFDTIALQGYLNNYKMVHYESYEETKTEAFLDSVRQSRPIFTIELVADGEERIVHGYRKPIREGYDLEGNPIKYDQDRLYIWVDSNEIYIGQYAIFDKLTKAVYFYR